MLSIYFKDENNKEKDKLQLVENVEYEILKIGIPETSLARKLIKKIERGSYNDNISFIDRFGFKLPLKCMSTGCKAALVVSENSSKLIDLRECGWNARDEIIKNCKYGNILIENNDIPYGYTEEEKDAIDVRLDKYRFKNISSLNQYIKNRELINGEYQLNGGELYEGMEVIE